MKGIADLDEVGFERVDGARPAQRIERQPVVERAGHQAALDHGNVAGRVACLNSPGTTRLWRQLVCARIHSCLASR